MHLNLLILFAVLSQAIIGTISSDNSNESTDLVRKKRVINMKQGRDEPARFAEFPYVVNIELLNSLHCTGSIISTLTVITSAFCASASAPISAYKIMSGSMFHYGVSAHNVIDKRLRFGNYGGTRTSDGIALFIVDVHFTFRFTDVITLHAEPIPPGVPATVAGWGCYYVPGVRGTEHPTLLRSITVPIMPHEECARIYRQFYAITEEDVCIYDEYQHCGNTDSGAPLIIDGKLAGVYIRRGPFTLPRDPEIFALLQHARYSQWIRDNIVHARRN